MYVNSFTLISETFEEEYKEFAMGATSMSYALGITLSAASGKETSLAGDSCM